MKAISNSKMSVALGGQEQEIPLIADFAAEESKQLAQVREARAQVQQQQKAAAVVAANTLSLSAGECAPTASESECKQCSAYAKCSQVLSTS